MGHAEERGEAPPRYSFLGIEVDAVTLPGLIDRIDAAGAGAGPSLIGNHNLHSVYLFHHCEQMARFYRGADCIHCDGMSLVWLARLFGHPLNVKNRVTYLDLIDPLARRAVERGWRLFFLGSEEAVAARGAERLRRAYPGIQLETHSGYFDLESQKVNDAILTRISDFDTDVLLVGMGMPRQERWILSHLDRIEARVIMNAGAIMDYLAGAVATPPRWMGPLGLEWLFRLATNPAHLWRRYLVEPWFIARLAAAELLRGRQAPTRDRDLGDRS